MTDAPTFGELNFAHAQLGDARRTARLIRVVDQMCRHPGGTLPHKMKSPKDLKALYRLCDCDSVTHKAILAAHRQHTLQKIEQHDGRVLVLHDATEFDYTTIKPLADQLGQIGKGNRRGYICQNSLAVDPQTNNVLGLVNQVLHCRDEVPKNETRKAKRERESRESRLWIQGTKGLPQSPQIIDVCDRGADTFEFLEHEIQSGRNFVVRAVHDRSIFTGHGDGPTGQTRLFSYLREQPSQGQRTIRIQAKEDRVAREATVALSFAPVRLIPPTNKRGEHGDEPIAVWCLHVRELDPPPEVKNPVEWFLITREPLQTFEDAARVNVWYEQRWIVEEFHKAKKTGCAIEHLQFQTVERLQPAIAVISVVALTLLNLRDASRRADAKTRAATELFCEEYVDVLSSWRWKRIRSDLTIHDFFYALARLGGHQNRKHDHLPGWLVLWRGWTTLQAMVDGASAIRKQCG